MIIQRDVEDEFDAWLGRGRHERRPDHQRGLRNYGGGLRNGLRPRMVQTAEGELEIEIPQVREAAETFASKAVPAGAPLCGWMAANDASKEAVMVRRRFVRDHIDELQSELDPQEHAVLEQRTKAARQLAEANGRLEAMNKAREDLLRDDPDTWVMRQRQPLPTVTRLT